MDREEYLIIFGLLLLQALAALYFSQVLSYFLIELVVALWFLMVAGLFLSLAREHILHAVAIATFSFLVAIVHSVILSLYMVSLWLVVVLALSVAGMVLSWDVLDRKKRVVSTKYTRRKQSFLMNPSRQAPPKIVVYHEETTSAARKSKVRKKSKTTKTTSQKPVKKAHKTTKKRVKKNK